MSGKNSNWPAATSTPQTTGQQDQLWLQQVDLDAVDAFLDQLDETPAKGLDNHNQPVDKSINHLRSGSLLSLGSCYQSRGTSASTCQKYHLINYQMNLL